MGKKILATGLVLSLLFSSILHVVTADSHEREVLSFSKTDDIQHKEVYLQTSGAQAEVCFKLPLFRGVYALFAYVFPKLNISLTLIGLVRDFTATGKERLASFLYPAHAFP